MSQFSPFHQNLTTVAHDNDMSLISDLRQNYLGRTKPHHRATQVATQNVVALCGEDIDDEPTAILYKASGERGRVLVTRQHDVVRLLTSASATACLRLMASREILPGDDIYTLVNEMLFIYMAHAPSCLVEID